MALTLGVEVQTVENFEHIAQDIARAELVAQFGEDFADLVFDGARAFGGLAEPCEEGEQLLIDKADQVVADHRTVMIERAVQLGGRPFIPAVLAIDDGRVCLSIQFSAVAAFGFKVMQVFQEQHPRRLFNVVKFVGDAFFGAQLAFDAVECVFVHGSPCGLGLSLPFALPTAVVFQWQSLLQARSDR